MAASRARRLAITAICDPCHLEPLARQARAEGYAMLDRLLAEWGTPAAQFSGAGEAFLGLRDDSGSLLAVGGVHRDAYTDIHTVGRIRRVYVTAGARRRGVGTALVERLLDVGKARFATIRLRVPDARAAALYEKVGFVACSEPETTHRFVFGAKRLEPGR